MDTQADIYQYVAKINKARKAASVGNHLFVERYVLDNFYAFSKGDMLVLLTNISNTVSV